MKGQVINNFIPYQHFYFSNSHLYSAALFAKEAKEYENINKICKHRSTTDLEFNEHTSYVISAVVMSSAYLEALINEILYLIHFEIKEKCAESFLKIDKETRCRISKLWDMGIPEKFSTLDKFEYFLLIAYGTSLCKDNYMYQNVQILIRLRNYFIHYKPEKIHIQSDADKVETTKLGKQLRGKFPTNPIASVKASFFPEKCLSYGCSIWAVRSVLEFADMFSDKIGKSGFTLEIKKKISGLLNEEFI